MVGWNKTRFYFLSPWLKIIFTTPLFFFLLQIQRNKEGRYTNYTATSITIHKRLDILFSIRCILKQAPERGSLQFKEKQPTAGGVACPVLFPCLDQTEGWEVSHAFKLWLREKYLFELRNSNPSLCRSQILWKVNFFNIHIVLGIEFGDCAQKDFVDTAVGDLCSVFLLNSFPWALINI